MLGGCGTPGGASPGTSPPPAPFSEVDQRTSPYFIALEGTGLVESQGAERVYNLGVNACSKLDQGSSVKSEVEGLAVEAKLGDVAGSLVGAAVGHLCPQHRPAAEDYVSQN